VCTGNVKSTGDSPIFSVSVARATAHTEAEMVWRFPAAVCEVEGPKRRNTNRNQRERESKEWKSNGDGAEYYTCLIIVWLV